MEGAVVVIASYPRSGNGWFARFLHYIAEGRGISPFMARSESGFESLRVPRGNQSRRLLPLDEWSAKSQEVPSVLFYKTHYKRAPSFPPGMLPKTVYLVRDPIRVFVSLLHFRASTQPDVSKELGSLISSGNINQELADFVQIMGFRSGTQVRGSWAENVQFWTSNSRANVISRYEDRMANPQSEHTAILEALEFKPEPGEVEKALARADPTSPKTIRLRNTDSYVESALDSALIKTFRDRYRAILEPLGYA